VEHELPNRHITIYEALKRISFIDNPLYHNEEAHKLLTYDLHKDPNAFLSKKTIAYTSDESSSYMPALCDYYTLKQPAEQKLFYKMNYAKFKAKEKLTSLETDNDFDEAAKYLDIAHATRHLLINHNLRLVVSVAKTFKVDNNIRFEDHISNGNVSVIKAVDHFDVSRGYKFSTYLVYTLKMNYWKIVQVRKKDIPSALKVSNELADQYMPAAKMEDSYKQVFTNDQFKAIVDVMDKVLTKKQKKILFHRFGVNGCKKKTLLEIGQEYKCTREWIRQVQMQAIAKIQAVLRLDDPA
jgi:RNA polymerase sigma factor (sigma-70 family)